MTGKWGEKIINGELSAAPFHSLPGYSADPNNIGWVYGHDYPIDDAAYNTEGLLVGATLAVLVEKMTPHDSIVDPAFAAIFFMTFRLFSNPCELTDALVERFNLQATRVLAEEDVNLWQQRKGIPVRLRVSNFVKTWVELYWRTGIDDVSLPSLILFTENALAPMFQGPAARIMDLLLMRNESSHKAVSPRADQQTIAIQECPSTLRVALRQLLRVPSANNDQGTAGQTCGKRTSSILALRISTRWNSLAS